MEAIKYYEKGIKYNPYSKVDWLKNGNQLFSIKEYSKALIYYK